MPTKGNLFAGVPDGSEDLLAQRAQDYLIKGMKVPEHLGITIRVTKKQGRYYVSEWRVGKQTYRGTPEEMPIARISPIRGRKST